MCIRDRFVGAGANKKFNSYIQGEFMPSNPDFIGVGAYRPESNIYSGLSGFEGRNNEKNSYGKTDLYGRPTSLGGITNIEEEKKKFEKRKKEVKEVEPKKKPKYHEITQDELDDILKKLPKDEEKAPYADQLQKELDFRKDFAGSSFMAQGLKNFGDSYMEGSKVFAEDVLPSMVAGTQSVLNAGAQGTRALAGVYGIPIQPIPRMGYYS